VKRAEDKDALVLRLVERHGHPAECRLHYTANAGSAALCDMMEWNKLEELPAEDHGATHSVHLRFSPFEIKTVIIEK
jgi:alpha-mannosidase